VLDYLLVTHRTSGVQDDYYQVASTRYGDDLPTPTLPVFGTLDDTRQVQQLDLGALVLQHARNASQGRELVSCDFGEYA
jgi:hypothetical protein